MKSVKCSWSWWCTGRGMEKTASIIIIISIIILLLFIWNRCGAHWPASHSNLVLSYFSLQVYLFACSFESYCSSKKKAIANPMKIQWSAIYLFSFRQLNMSKMGSLEPPRVVHGSSFCKSPLGWALLYLTASSVILKGRMQNSVFVTHSFMIEVKSGPIIR